MHALPSGIVRKCRGLTVCNFRETPLIFALFAALTTNAQPLPIQAQPHPGGPSQSSAEATLRFEVVSVKLSAPGANPLEHRQYRNTDPGRVRYINVSLKDVMLNAYSLKDYQIIGPEWLNGIDVDIEGTMREGTTKEQLRVMFQNLLADRFRLTFHWAPKNFPLTRFLSAEVDRR